LGILIVDPAVAKFAPCVKFDPRELRYGLRLGSPKLCAEITKFYRLELKIKFFQKHSKYPSLI
jgi:hypothetical protein